MPHVSFDSYWKVSLASALMHIPGPCLKGAKVKKVKGIGSYYYPTETNNSNTSSAIMFVHGGGRVMGSASGAIESTLLSRFAILFGIPVLSAHYSLWHPFPVPLDDLHKAYHWLSKDMAEKQNIGEKGGAVRIALCGDSAGAGLAAELCQRLLDESQAQKESTEQSAPLPVCQLLLEPMLDDRTCVDDELLKLPPHLVWNNKSNIYGWSSYLGPNHKPGDETLPKYAAASRRADLSNLPPACILVGDLDLFHDESQEYAQRLKRDGVETEFHELKGFCHGAMIMGKDLTPVQQDVFEKIHTFGKRHLFDCLDKNDGLVYQS